MNPSNSAALSAQLPDIGNGLSAALSELQRDPEPFKCEAMAIQLDGARRHCLRLAEAVRQERGNGQCGR